MVAVDKLIEQWGALPIDCFKGKYGLPGLEMYIGLGLCQQGARNNTFNNTLLFLRFGQPDKAAAFKAQHGHPTAHLLQAAVGLYPSHMAAKHPG